MESVHIANTSDIPAGEGKVFNAKGKAIAIFNVDGKFYAIDNTCKHQGGPLGDGFLDENIVTCPWHGWQYDVTTGKSISTPVHVTSYKLKVENSKILVDI